ncbi:MAG TPA: hypothetical protein VFU19_10090 [Iamia sp.]|nr:hypothetical protein [Iamia sp.]
MGVFGSKKGKGGDQQPLPDVVRISADQPEWLPPRMRSVAVGEYTFLCPRCDAFPSNKWPGEGGAVASAEIHLGVSHGQGTFAGMSKGLETWEMIPRR